MIVLALAIYFAPAIIAAMRRHRSGMAIFLVNLLLGWTVIGWFVALIWAFANSGNNSQSVVVQTTVVNQAPNAAPTPIANAAIIPAP